MSENKYPVYVEPYLLEIEKWARVGVEEREIARKLGVSKQTFSGYKKNHPELVEALRKGRSDSCITIKNALYEAAIGITTVTTKTTSAKAESGETERRVEQTKTQHPPSVAAACALLKNWDDSWSDKPAELNLKREELEFKKMLAENEHWDILQVVESV